MSSLADLKGKKLGAQAGTTGLDYANKEMAANGYSIVEYPDLASQTQALLTGGRRGDQRPAGLVRRGEEEPGQGGRRAQFDTGEVYGFGMKLGNTALKNVDEVIKTAKADGTYNMLFQKWIGTDAPKS